MDFFSVKEIGKELTLNLSDDQAGRLIGRGGKTINSLRKRFNGITINIDRYGEPRVVKISGPDKVCVYGLILTQIL